MRIFGYELRKAAGAKPPTLPQLRDNEPQGPLTPFFANWHFRKVSGSFYELLREGIPIIDAAIRRLISLNGTIRIIGDNGPIVSALEDFCLNVPVNDTQKGIHAFLENFSNETFEQGFSVSEFIATPDYKDIAGLRVADSKNIVFRYNEQRMLETYYYNNNVSHTYGTPGQQVADIINAGNQQSFVSRADGRKLNPASIMYHSINNENSNPYGVSIMRSLEFVSQILVTLQTSIKNVGERFGDPSYHIHLRSSKAGSNENLEARRQDLQNDFNAVIAAKRAGKSADLVTAGSLDSEVVVNVIGHQGQLLQYDAPLRHVLEQIVAKTNLPAWMLGIYWSTTERMATLEIEAALQDAKIRQLAMLPELIRLLSVYLSLRGYTWKTITTSPDKAGDWGIIFETPNLRDLVAQAQARFLNAQADMMGSYGAAPQTQIQLTGASAEINGLKLPVVRKTQKNIDTCDCQVESQQTKELMRTIPWPELDKVEAEFEAELKYDWREFQSACFTILKLLVEKSVKADEKFTMSDEQRRAIEQALLTYINAYDPNLEDSPVVWYYGQSMSLGYIHAAHVLGHDKPLLNIVRNAEISADIFRNGFELVKDNAIRAHKDTILPALERHILAGSNPLDAARDLERIFNEQNSRWERLARSEMSMAAEDAKKAEWKEWGVKRQEFAPAPDGCPLCLSLAGDYPIDQCPVPVRNTHPRCRCSTRPALSEVYGTPGA